MIRKISIYESSGTDPEKNLALEEYLLFHTEPGECILYLWQNAHTVVIGRNQNCWKECNVSLLTEEGGTLVRRLSGGGAVYHDLGNLNFTFLVRKEDYNLEKQLLVIKEAVESFGIPVEKSGRNDLLAYGRKFSGNAFYESGGYGYHHGTLLLNVDTEKLSRYLTVSKEKLKAKGVDSVRSRVGNLKDFCPEICVRSMKQAMKEAFSRVYGCTPEKKILGEKADVILEKLEAKYASFDWKYGKKLAFTNSFSRRFSWGEIELAFSVDQGVIREAAFYSDSLNPDLSEMAQILSGCVYEREAVKQCLLENEKMLGREVAEDLSALIWEKL